nr:hypothetical protein [Tanacetum cinerariifolium]
GLHRNRRRRVGFDPPGHGADVVQRRLFRVTEMVPVRQTPRLDVPVGDDVIAPQQRAVEGASVVDQALP